jgi:uncharacterized protein (UPF0261 family)
MFSMSKQGGRFFEKNAICSLVAAVEGPVIQGEKIRISQRCKIKLKNENMIADGKKKV